MTCFRVYPKCFGRLAVTRATEDIGERGMRREGKQDGVSVLANSAEDRWKRGSVLVAMHLKEYCDFVDILMAHLLLQLSIRRRQRGKIKSRVYPSSPLALTFAFQPAYW